MITQTITIEKAITKIKESNGRIFSILFVKKNGEERKMVCRTGVVKYLKGTGARYSFEEKRLVSVYDIQKMDYRCFSMDAMKQLKINSMVYAIKGDR